MAPASKQFNKEESKQIQAGKRQFSQQFQNFL